MVDTSALACITEWNKMAEGRRRDGMVKGEADTTCTIRAKAIVMESDLMTLAMALKDTVVMWHR